MNNTIQVALDERGRILIPESEREHVQLAPGMTLVVEDAEGGGLRLSAQPPHSILVEEDGILVADVEPLEDLTDIVRRERERRLQELIQRT